MAPKPKAFADPAVAAVFERYPRPLRDRLLALRQLIFDTAAATDGVGALDETLKWGQPSYLTAATNSGTTIRIDALKGDPSRYALFVHCQTSLIETFRELYPEAMHYEGKRAIHFDVADDPPEEALSHCIGLALTYHRNKVKRAL
jgi:hypothetical protein